MPIIQILLVLAVVVIFIFFLRHHGTTRTAAGFKVGFVIFVAFGLTAVLWPSGVSKAAKLVGVGRGTDLLLYALVVALRSTRSTPTSASKRSTSAMRGWFGRWRCATRRLPPPMLRSVKTDGGARNLGTPLRAPTFY